jgi:hypothetical protein
MLVYVRQTALLYMVTVMQLLGVIIRTGVVMYRIILSIGSSRHTRRGRKNKR